MATNFIYTNPSAGQQAVQYAQLQAQDDADKRRLLGATLHDMSVQGIEAGRNNAQMGYSRAQLMNRSAEAERDRALQREGYRSAESINTARSAAIDAERTRRATEQAAYEKDQLLRQQQAFFQAGETDAAMMNDPKVDKAVKAKIAQGRNVKPGANGLWVNAHPNPALLAPALPTIADLKAKQAAATGANRALISPGYTPVEQPAAPIAVPFTSGTGDVGHVVPPRIQSMDFGGWSEGGWNSVPRTEAPMPPVEFRPTMGDLRMLDSNIPSAPAPRIPSTYDEWINPQVPFDEFIPTYNEPRRRVPFAILPY